MDETKFKTYVFSRMASVLVLDSTWLEIKGKLELMIKKVENTPITSDEILLLRDTLEKFERKCINRILRSAKPNNLEENLKFEPEEVHDVIIELPQILADFFNVFLGNVTFTSNGSRHTRMPDSIKFRVYNLDLRDKKKNGGANHAPNYKVCDFEHGYELNKENRIKGELMQGYWQVESMIIELRNHEEHWRKGGGRKFLKEDLKRKIMDPVTNSETPGNHIILVSVLVLLSYLFVDVLQTWLDTITLLETYNIQ
jgi:hypothetical protein